MILNRLLKLEKIFNSKNDKITVEMEKEFEKKLNIILNQVEAERKLNKPEPSLDEIKSEIKAIKIEKNNCRHSLDLLLCNCRLTELTAMQNRHEA